MFEEAARSGDTSKVVITPITGQATTASRSTQHQIPLCDTQTPRGATVCSNPEYISYDGGKMQPSNYQNGQGETDGMQPSYYQNGQDETGGMQASYYQNGQGETGGMQASYYENGPSETRPVYQDVVDLDVLVSESVKPVTQTNSGPSVPWTSATQSDIPTESEYAYVDGDSLGITGSLSQELYESLDEVATPDATPSPHRANSTQQKEVAPPTGFVTSAGCNIFIHNHDITKLKVDVIVTRSRSDLRSDDYVIRAAGQQLLDDLGNITAERGLLEEAEVIETLGWNLPCKQVLHAVYPRWSRTGTYVQRLECLDLLKKTIHNVLDYASGMGVTSMAIPMLGSG
jgi:hypothetical protein